MSCFEPFEGLAGNPSRGALADHTRVGVSPWAAPDADRFDPKRSVRG